MWLTALTAGLVLILLLLEARETLGGVHSLCLNFTVRAKASPGKPWCEAQGSLDGKPFLQYDSNSGKVTPLKVKVKETTAWTDLTQSLEGMGRELRMVLLVTKLEKIQSRVPSSLQGKLCCQRIGGQCTGVSWEFSINGQKAIINTMNMTWTVIDPGARGIIKEWESNQELAEYFRKISTVFCCHWLKEFLEHSEKTEMPTETPLKLPYASQPPCNSTGTQIILPSLIALLMSSVTTLIVNIIIFRKCKAVPAEASLTHEKATSLDQHENCHLKRPDKVRDKSLLGRNYMYLLDVGSDGVLPRTLLHSDKHRKQ